MARKLPLARDTSAKPTARDKTPNQIRHRLRTPAESINALNRDNLEDASLGPWVSMIILLNFRKGYREDPLASIAL
jgi:hypothetical protein